MSAWEKVVAPLKNRIANMVARAFIKLVDDTPKMQEVQLAVLADETRDKVERFQEYGFSSVPLADAEAVVLFVGGKRDHGFVVATDDRRYRVKGLTAGEVTLYSDQGDQVYLKRGRVVVISPEIRLGSDGGATHFVALENLVTAQLNALKSAISSAPVVPGDGGASFKAAILASLATWPGSVAATKVKAE